MVWAYVANSSSEYPPFLESLEQVLENTPTGDSIILIEDFNAHVGNGVKLMDFCASQFFHQIDDKLD